MVRHNIDYTRALKTDEESDKEKETNYGILATFDIEIAFASAKGE